MDGPKVSAPRVNAELLHQNIGRRVRLVGQLVSVDQGTLQLKTSDNHIVTVLLQARKFLIFKK